MSVSIPINLLQKCVDNNISLTPDTIKKLLAADEAQKKLNKPKESSSATVRPVIPLKSISDTPTIGIGITTYKRPDLLKRCLDEIDAFKPPNSEIFVNDDTDLEEGVARSKNKCLTALAHCDYIFLFDDDAWPIKKEWWIPFITYAIKYNCHYFSPSWLAKTVGSDGPCLSIEEPNGVVQFLTSHAVALCGGYSIFFQRYGGEHEEFARRCYTQGLTPFPICDISGSLNYFYSLDREKEVISTISYIIECTSAKNTRSIINSTTYNWAPYKQESIIVTLFTLDGKDIVYLSDWIKQQKYPVIVLTTTPINTKQYPHIHSIFYSYWNIIQYFDIIKEYISSIYLMEYSIYNTPPEHTNISSLRIGCDENYILKSLPLARRHNRNICLPASVHFADVADFIEILNISSHPCNIRGLLYGLNVKDMTAYKGVDSSPVLLILGCKKYFDSLTLAIQRFASQLFHVVGIVGGAEEVSFDGSILHLPVSDTYDDHPKKMYEAFRWAYNQYPNAIGIFKTDEDIVIDSQSEFETLIMTHYSRLYWGFNTETKTEGGLISQSRVDARFDDKIGEKRYPAASYCWGHGYWLSRGAVSLLLNHKEDYYSQCLEDVCTGSSLNRHGIKPVKLTIKYTECVREDLLKGIITSQTLV